MTSPLPFGLAHRRLKILRRQSEPIRPAVPRPVRRDCHGRLHSALQALAGAEIQVLAEGLKPWCSATFVGAQHQFRVSMPDRAAGDALAATLPDHEFTIPGHIVADLSIDTSASEGAGMELALSILTIEDW